MRVHGPKTDRGLAKNGLAEVELTREEGSGCGEIICLLSVRKDIWDIVTLIAPGVHIHGRIEDTERGVIHEAVGQRLRETYARRDVMRVGILQPAWIAVLSSDKDGRNAAAVECQVGVRITDVHQRIHELVACSHLDGCAASDTEAVLRETRGIPLPKLHLRNAGLALFHRGQSQ